MPHYSHQSYAMVIQARGINKSLLGPYHGDAYPRKCKVTKKAGRGSFMLKKGGGYDIVK